MDQYQLANTQNVKWKNKMFKSSELQKRYAKRNSFIGLTLSNGCLCTSEVASYVSLV